MGIKTEDMYKNLPPKVITEGVDWLGILDAFDPTKLEDRFINECARRNPYDTGYKSDPPMPVEERLKHSEFSIKMDRKDLENWTSRIEEEGLNHSLYSNARRALIKAIGSKGAHEYNNREYERLGEVGRELQAEAYRKWERELEETRRVEEQKRLEDMESGAYFLNPEPASLHEKVVKIRKGFLTSEGKPMTQRDFAKYLEYPINKYVEAEKRKWGCSSLDESPVENELIEKLIFRCRVNPYWLFDSDVDADYAYYDRDEEIVRMGDAPCVYTTPDVILQWIQEGKPRETSWWSESAKEEPEFY